jgi:hypothetical protein
LVILKEITWLNDRNFVPVHRTARTLSHCPEVSEIGRVLLEMPFASRSASGE